jgi:transcriptional regulator with XRE-family HTH domain
MDKVTLGARIREQRKERNLTLEKFATMAGIGTVYLGEIERGDKMPSIKTFVKIVNNMNLSADLLLRDEVKAANPYVLNEITEKMADLSPAQIKMVDDVFTAMLVNFKKME